MGDGMIHVKIWLLLAIGGAVFMVAKAIKHQRGRRRRSVIGGILVAVVMFAIVSAVLVKRNPPRIQITMDGNTRNHVVLPPIFSKLGIEEHVERFRQGVVKAEAKTNRFATEMLAKAQRGIEDAHAKLVLDNEDGSYLLLPPSSDKTALSSRWHRPNAVAPIAPVPPVPSNSHTPHQRLERGSLAWNLLAGLALLAFLFVGYVFLDAATRGQFTGQLRFLSVVAIVVAILASISLV